MANFFKEQTLGALRELALRQAALELETRHSEIKPEATGATVQRFEERAADRILIHITSDPATAMLIRRGQRVAEYLRAECFAVYVSRGGDLSNLPVQERELIERHLDFARNLRLETRILYSQDVPGALVEFAHSQKVTHLFVARQSTCFVARFFGQKLLSSVLRLAKDMQIIVVAERRVQNGSHASRES